MKFNIIGLLSLLGLTVAIAVQFFDNILLELMIWAIESLLSILILIRYIYKYRRMHGFVLAVFIEYWLVAVHFLLYPQYIESHLTNSHVIGRSWTSITLYRFQAPMLGSALGLAIYKLFKTWFNKKLSRPIQEEAREGRP